MRRRPLAPLALVALAWATLLATAAPPAWAGCGCDHPPPAWALVMPPFGSPGRWINVYADAGQFVAGETYEVEFGSTRVLVQATRFDRLEVQVPGGLPLGPVALRVRGAGYDRLYSSALFTALPNPRKIRERAGVFKARNYAGAVGADGTLYLPIDMTRVTDPMQFAVALLDLPLTYEHDDVVIYNSDGVDLTLFTLDVNDTERTWGSYYGWQVLGDAKIKGNVFKGKAGKSDQLASVSNVFTYWRHEFHTYAAAHAPGGEYAVDVAGYHSDGTLHVDHYQLVIAISGLERDPSAPLDLSRAAPLSPGSRTFDLGWISLLVSNPVELVTISPLVNDARGSYAELLEEGSLQGGD